MGDKFKSFCGVFRQSALLIADQCYGRKGVWAHEVFEHINAAFFGGRLPHPHIVWGLTAYGSCFAWASCSQEHDRQPVITLHPTLLAAGEAQDPWGIPRRWLGPSLVFDTLLHECIHLHVNTHLGGRDGPTSHDCNRWVRQINRLAPCLGVDGVRFGRSKIARVPIRGAGRTVRGKLPTRVRRISTGNVPYSVGAMFPMSLRQFKGTAATHYSTNCLPNGVPRL